MEFKVDMPVGFTAPPRPETALTERYNPPICHSIITPFGQSKAPVSSAVPPGAQSQPVLFMLGGDGQRSGGRGHLWGPREDSGRPARWFTGSARGLTKGTKNQRSEVET